MPDDVGDRQLPHVSEREDRIAELVHAAGLVTRENAAIDVVCDLARAGGAGRSDVARLRIAGGQNLFKNVDAVPSARRTPRRFSSTM
jgi:hypothetical protein